MGSDAAGLGGMDGNQAQVGSSSATAQTKNSRGGVMIETEGKSGGKVGGIPRLPDEEGQWGDTPTERLSAFARMETKTLWWGPIFPRGETT